MKYHEFIGEIEHTLQLDTEGQAVKVARAVLTTFGERIGEGEASDLAAQLPMELDRYLEEAASNQDVDFETFVERVADRADVDYPTALYYAKTVVALIAATVEPTELREVRTQLPPEYDELFELAEQVPPEV